MFICLLFGGGKGLEPEKSSIAKTRLKMAGQVSINVDKLIALNFIGLHNVRYEEQVKCVFVKELWELHTKCAIVF